MVAMLECLRFVPHLLLSFSPPLFLSPFQNRWNPDKEDKPSYQSYNVDINRYVERKKRTAKKKEV